MTAVPFEVAIPALPGHLAVLASSIPRLRAALGTGPLVVTPDPSALAALASLGARVAADADCAAKSRPRVAEQLPGSKRQGAGWYYRRLFKYDVVLRAAEQVLILEADKRRAHDAIAFEGPAHETTIPRRLAARALFLGRLCMGLRRHM